MDVDNTQPDRLKSEASKPVPAKETTSANLNAVPGNPDEAVLAGWSEHDAGGTGDCFYRAFCAATHAQDNPGKTLKAEDLKLLAADARARVVLHVRKHKDRFSQHYAPDPKETPAMRSQQPVADTVDKWLHNHSLPSTWACGLAIQAMVEASGIPVIIWKLKGGIWERYTMAGKFAKDGKAMARKNSTPVVLILKGGHFTFCTPKSKNEPIPRPWLMQTQKTIVIDLTGGVKSCRAASVGTPSLHTIKSPSQGTPSLHSIPSSLSKTAATRAITKCSNNSSTGQGQKRALPKQKAQPCVWTCKLCHSRFEAETPKQLSEMSRNHNARRHPDRDKTVKNGTRQYVEVVIPSRDIPLEQRAWCCPHCHKGLPHLPYGQHRKSVQAHNAAEHPRVKVNSVKSRKRLWKRWREDKSSVPSLARGINLRVARQHKSKQKRLHKNKCGHKAVLFHPDWATIPKTAKSASPKQHKGTGATCTRCCPDPREDLLFRTPFLDL